MNGTPTPVFHIITMLELGGAQQNTLHTVASLNRTEFAPHLVCGPGGLLDAEARALGIPLHFIPELIRPIRPLEDWRAARSIASILKPHAAKGPVVVHTHSSKAGVVGRLAAHMAKASPVVHSIHGFGHEAIHSRWKRRMVLATERYMARYTDAFISVSRCSLDEGRRLNLLGQAPQRVIRSGIDLEDFGRADSLREETRRELGYSPNGPVVGMIACLKPQKAPLDFVEMAALVRESDPETRFFLAGDGELRSAVEQRVRELGLSDCFDLLGWRRDMAALLGTLDVLVLTSRWEGLPRVCPQAMAAGRPVVATRVDGIPEAVVDSRNGFLVEPGDIEGAAQRVVQFLKDPELRQTFGQSGRKHVQEFDQRQMVADQEALYRDLLAGR
jgi:glycosyltransferase involved in cell wall biosynthesis